MELRFLYIIEILGTFSFAVSGASFAMEKKLDPFGVLILSFVTAIGGGTLRDIMIGHLPVSWLRDITVINVIVFAAIGTMLFDKYLKRLTATLFLFDALGWACSPLLVLKWESSCILVSVYVLLLERSRQVLAVL